MIPLRTKLIVKGTRVTPFEKGTDVRIHCTDRRQQWEHLTDLHGQIARIHCVWGSIGGVYVYTIHFPGTTRPPVDALEHHLTTHGARIDPATRHPSRYTRPNRPRDLRRGLQNGPPPDT